LYLNKRPETLKLVHKRAGNIVNLIDIGNNFLNRTHGLVIKRKDWQIWNKKAFAQQKK
jgi:hypothetical protein